MRFFLSATCFPVAKRFGGLLSAFARSSARAPRMRLFGAAEIWVRTPEDDNRRAALSAANDSDRRKPTTWLAFAAGWSGGSLLPADQKPIPPPAGACAMAANAAIMMAVAAGDPRAVGGQDRGLRGGWRSLCERGRAHGLYSRGGAAMTPFCSMIDRRSSARTHKPLRIPRK